MVEETDDADVPSSADWSARAVQGLEALGITARQGPSVTWPTIITVGAGDTFGGSFLACWLEHGFGCTELADADLLEDAMTFAARAAAINCTRAGAEPPTRAEMGLE